MGSMLIVELPPDAGWRYNLTGTPTGCTMRRMKATVYVPDDLWDRAKRITPPDTNPSQLVQGALDALLKLREPEPFNAFDRPREEEVFDEHLYQAERLRRQAQETYEAGYAAGVKAADMLSWTSLEDCADVGFDINQWLMPIRHAISERLVKTGSSEAARAAVESDFPMLPAMREAMGTLIDPTAGKAPKGVWLRGFSDALQDLYEVVLQPQHVSSKGGIDGSFQRGGRVLHREYGSGVIEDMRSRPSDGRTEALIQFDVGRRRRLPLDDNDDIVGVPDDAVERLTNDADQLFKELVAKRDQARQEFQELLRSWRSGGRPKLMHLSELATESSDQKSDEGGE